MNGLSHEVPSGDGILTLGVLEGLLYTSLRNLRRYFESEVPAVFMRGVLWLHTKARSLSHSALL